jgi:hypothetical protein
MTTFFIAQWNPKKKKYPQQLQEKEPLCVSMSALGHKQTNCHVRVMSALLPKADMCSALADVCFGPIADMR